MRKVCKETDGAVYSEVLVSVGDIKLKKEYMACPNCRRATIQESLNFWQCIKCSKMVDPLPTLIISLVLADSTGSFDVEIIGNKV